MVDRNVDLALQAAGSGALNVDPEKLVDAAKHIQTFLDSLDNASKDLNIVATLGQFGNFDMGTKLQQKYFDKAQSSDDAISKRLTELGQEANKIKQLIQTAAANYVRVNGGNVDLINQAFKVGK